jgi:hypothetical protein
MTLATLLQDLYRRHRYQTSPASAVTTRLTAFVNEAHRELLGLPGMARLRDDTVPITALANVARLGLPPSVGRLRNLVDRANNHELTEIPLGDLRTRDPAQAATGGPLEYAIAGWQAVQQQPATTGLWAVSSSASDTTPKIFVETLTTGNYAAVTAVAGTTITGTTRVQLGTRVDHLDVVKVYLDAAAVGNVSLYDAATGGHELTRIAAGHTYSRLLAVEWYPIPTVDTLLYADITRTVSDLVNPGDEPFLPADFHYVVELGARAKEYEFLDDTRIGQARADYVKGQMALRSFVLTDSHRVASLRHTDVRASTLGPQFPAGA